MSAVFSMETLHFHRLSEQFKKIVMKVFLLSAYFEKAHVLHFSFQSSPKYNFQFNFLQIKFRFDTKTFQFSPMS